MEVITTKEHVPDDGSHWSHIPSCSTKKNGPSLLKQVCFGCLNVDLQEAGVDNVCYCICSYVLMGGVGQGSIA